MFPKRNSVLEEQNSIDSSRQVLDGVPRGCRLWISTKSYEVFPWYLGSQELI